MSQSIKEELIETLDRLSLEKLLVVLHFAQRIEQQAPEQMAASAGVSTEEAERAMAIFWWRLAVVDSGDTRELAAC